MTTQSLKKLELDKILSACAAFATLDGTGAEITATLPSCDLEEVRRRLAYTAECDRLLFRYGAGKIEYFPDVTQIIRRAGKGSALSCKELLDVNALLRSTRNAYRSVKSADQAELPITCQTVAKLYFDEA